MEKGSIKKLFFRFFSGLDRQLSLTLLALAIVGLVTFLSASQNTPVRLEDELRNLALAFVVMWTVSRIPPKWLELAAVWVYGFGLALLLAVAAFGLVKKGARRWLNIGFIIQPSELMKIAMPLMLAWYFQKREGIQKNWDYGAAALIFYGQKFIGLGRDCRGHRRLPCDFARNGHGDLASIAHFPPFLIVEPGETVNV